MLCNSKIKTNMKYWIFIILVAFGACHHENNFETFTESGKFELLFSNQKNEINFSKGTIAQVIDSMHQNCDFKEYTGDYNILLELNNENKTKRKVGFKGYICPHSLRDAFYNPFNVYLINDSLFIEKNLNSINPTINSAEFGEFIGIDSLSRNNLNNIEVDSLFNIIKTHIYTSIAHVTYPPLIQVISDENTSLADISIVVKSALKVYYEVYTDLSKNAFNKQLEKLDTLEMKKTIKLIDESELNCNIRINSYQRIEKSMTLPPLPMNEL